MARKPERYPALYERLSHDDELQGESNSISNQKRILEDYAEQHGFTNCIHFTDDGISGTQFDRPGFQKMIAEVKADRISVVIIKDMSRFGRDYLQVGTYMEVLRKHDTRLIALNDSVDTLKGDDEFTPFRNIMNEWYARDTSKKIRSAFQAKNLAGKHTSSSVPYGYLKSEQDKNQWVIDPVAAPIVQRIYRMTMEGKGPYQIAAILSAEHIEIPAYYHQKLGIGLWQTREIRDPYKWGSSTIVHILTNPCYLGHTCNFKTRKHFKDKKSHYVDQDQWTIMPPSCNCSCFAFTTEQEILLGRNSDFLTEIERLNQNVVYKLTDGVYSFTGNEKEKNELEEEQKDCQQQLDSAEKQADNTNHFIELAKKYTDFSELTPAMVNEFVSKIIVHRPFELNGTRAVQVEVYLNYIGKFDVPEEPMILSEEELATQKIREEKLEKHRIASRKYMAKYRKRLKEMKKAGTILPENLPAETKGEWL